MDLRRVLESAGTGSLSEAAPAPASSLGARLSVAVVVLYRRRWWWRRRRRKGSKGGAQHERDAKAAHEALNQEAHDARGYSRATRRFGHTSLRSTNEGAHGAARLRDSKSCARGPRAHHDSERGALNRETRNGRDAGGTRGGARPRRASRRGRPVVLLQGPRAARRSAAPPERRASRRRTRARPTRGCRPCARAAARASR